MEWRQSWLSGLSVGRRSATPVNGVASAADDAMHLLSAAELIRPASVLFVLLLLVVGSSLAVIFSAYQYRVLFNQHQNLVANWDELQVEWGQLVLEESSWAANNRIEQIASKRLDMLVPEPGMIEIVRHER